MLALELGVDEVGAAVVVDADARRLDEQAERAAHAVVPEPARLARRGPHLADERDPTEGDLAVSARDEADLDVAEADERTVRRNLDELALGQPFGAAPCAGRRGADELRLRVPRDARSVGDVVVVAVAAEDRIDLARDVARDREIVGDHSRAIRVRPGRVRNGIDEEGRLRATR